MADAGKPSITPGSGADDKSGNQKRKIAGKYDTVEDAVEAIAGASDKNYHEVREEMGAIRQLLERGLAPVGSRDRGYGDSGDDDQGYRRGRRDEDEDQIDTTDFLTNPGKHIKQREAKLKQQLQFQQGKIIQNMVANAATVLRFQMKNPDLDEHEKLVQGFLADTDERAPLNRRLDDAAKKTRAYLKSIKGDDDEDETRRNAGRKPNKDEYVEDAAGAGAGKGADDEGANDDEAKNEDGADTDLAGYVNERKHFKSARFAAPTTRK